MSMNMKIYRGWCLTPITVFNNGTLLPGYRYLKLFIYQVYIYSFIKSKKSNKKDIKKKKKKMEQQGIEPWTSRIHELNTE